MELGLAGRRAIVTGGSKGIGKAIAGELLTEGAAVTICSRHAEELETAATELMKDAAATELVNQVFLEFLQTGKVSRNTADRAGVSTRRSEIPSLVEQA